MSLFLFNVSYLSLYCIQSASSYSNCMYGLFYVSVNIIHDSFIVLSTDFYVQYVQNSFKLKSHENIYLNSDDMPNWFRQNILSLC